MLIKKRKSVVMFGFLLSLFIFGAISASIVSNAAQNDIEETYSELNEDLIDHPPIIIAKDADFSLYSFPGSGTPADPYLIENYNITGHPIGISIEGNGSVPLTINFIIRNCFIQAVIHVSK